MTAGGRAGRGRGVVVVGSANLDIVVPVERHPMPGETVLGGDHFRACGGKGANQAVAAARLGSDVAFVGSVGDDDAGRCLVTALTEAGVDVGALRVLEDAPSGIAMIAVDPIGENTIVVSPGANARLGAREVAAADGLISSAGAVLLQLEIPLDAVAAAAQRSEGIVILNPAPASSLPDGLLGGVDVLVPNRTELALLTGVEVPMDLAAVRHAVTRLPDHLDVVVTLGADGAYVRGSDVDVHLDPHDVQPLDATAAGDAFCGALAVAMVEGATLLEAAGLANAAAALTVTRAGAQPSLPVRSEVVALVARTGAMTGQGPAS